MKAKYRIVKDCYAGFEAQYKPWYGLFWMQCFGFNTSFSIERAKEVIERHKIRVGKKIIVWEDKQ